MNVAEKIIRMAQVGYGMFGADVVAGTVWDLQRNGIAPYLDRIGLDDWAKEYADVKFELVAIGTRSAPSANRAVEENERETGNTPYPYYGAQPWVYILRDHPDVDALIVATPDHLHYEPIMEALNGGAHVIAEKPLCLDVNEADTIIETAASKNRIVGVDMHKRYDPDHLKIFTELMNDLGAPIYARGVLEEPLEVSTTIFKWAEQSDPFTYVGIHWVDLFTHYLKLTPLSLYAVGQKQRLLKDFSKDAFDAVQVMVTHTNGLNVIYENNWITPKDFEGPVNQESGMVAAKGKVESDSQYRGLRYWIENKGSRTSNVHFFRKVRRPDGSSVSMGYGKDSLIDCMEKVCRVKFLGAKAEELAGTYPDATSQRLPTAIVHAAREVVRRNYEHFQQGKPPVVTASFGAQGITVHDPNAGENVRIYSKAI
jgi:predicted dehydrogenase